MRVGVLGVVALLLVAPAAGQASRKRTACARKHSKTILDDGRGRVFSVDRRGDAPAYFGCIRKTGRTQMLDRDEDNQFGLGRFQLRSPFVAYVTSDGGSGGTFQNLEVVDLEARREREVAHFVQFSGARNLRDYVLSRSGAIAWIRQDYSANGSNVSDERSLHKLDADGRATLDPGPGVEIGSLALSAKGRRVYCTNAGEPRSAPLR